jgi:hypothetical protein
MLCLVAIAALALPVAAAMADTAAPTVATEASQICKQQKLSLGADFAKTYGTNASKSNAFGKCVAKNAQNAQAALTNAAKACKTEQTADPAAFATKYGANGKAGTSGAAKDAFGKCVSAKAKAAAAAAGAAAPAAAKQCRTDAKADPAAYAQKYGTGHDAFGKCVAGKSKAK